MNWVFVEFGTMKEYTILYLAIKYALEDDEDVPSKQDGILSYK